MSIAVSAVVKSSRLLLLLTVTMCVGSAAIGARFGFDNSGALPLGMRAAVASTCLMAGLIVIYQMMCSRCANRIDISGNGQIRVTPIDVPSSAARRLVGLVGNGPQIQRLMPSSTLWSQLMILNLRADSGVKTTLLILPDSMSPTSFRALSVACHWIAAHNNRAENDIN